MRVLIGKPLPTTRESYEALDACIGHLKKYEIFARIADRTIPNLPKDREELDRYGASRNLYSTEFGALTEAMICELYSSLDGLLDFFKAIYPSIGQLQKMSFVSKLFQSVKEKPLSADFPESVRVVLAAAYNWFEDLRNLRREITHGTVGFCSFNEKKNVVAYFNQGLSPADYNKAFHIEDIVTVVRNFHKHVNHLFEEIAKVYLAQLLPIPRPYPCGLYQGLIYSRMIEPSADLNLNSGHCASWNWFEQSPEKFCPLAKHCGAYTRKWPGGDVAALAVK